ncbi:MAG: hypothetical protein V4687_01010 [Bacteroidota bacterium]
MVRTTKLTAIFRNAFTPHSESITIFVQTENLLDNSKSYIVASGFKDGQLFKIDMRLDIGISLFEEGVLLEHLITETNILFQKF